MAVALVRSDIQYAWKGPSLLLEAFRDHGQLRASLEEHVEDAGATIDALERVGISLSEVTDRLLEEGVTLFDEAFDALLSAVDKGRRS